MATKFVFITGGVVSSLGKGITAAALGRLLKCRGYSVSVCKLDPYLNVDPGTMNPYQHGEVYVTDRRPIWTSAITSGSSMKSFPGTTTQLPARFTRRSSNVSAQAAITAARCRSSRTSRMKFRRA